jgi:hypothetical protein
MPFMDVYKFSFISNECCTIISFIRNLLVFFVFYMCVGARCKLWIKEDKEKKGGAIGRSCIHQT